MLIPTVRRAWPAATKSASCSSCPPSSACWAPPPQRPGRCALAFLLILQLQGIAHPSHPFHMTWEDVNPSPLPASAALDPSTEGPRFSWPQGKTQISAQQNRGHFIPHLEPHFISDYHMVSFGGKAFLFCPFPRQSVVPVFFSTVATPTAPVSSLA